MGKWNGQQTNDDDGLLATCCHDANLLTCTDGRCSEMCDGVDTTEERRKSRSSSKPSKGAAKKQSVRNDKAKKRKRE